MFRRYVLSSSSGWKTLVQSNSVIFRVDYVLLKISQCVEGMRLKSNQLNLKEFCWLIQSKVAATYSWLLLPELGFSEVFRKTNHNRLNPCVCVIRKMKPCYCKWRWYDLGLFAKLRKATINVIMSVCLSVRPSARPLQTTRLPLDGF